MQKITVTGIYLNSTKKKKYEEKYVLKITKNNGRVCGFDDNTFLLFL